MAMASGASVTVSIAADTTGMFSWIFGVSCARGADLVGEHVGLGRQQQDVVEREPFLGELRRVAAAIGSLTARRRAFTIAGEGAGRGLHGESLVAVPLLFRCGRSCRAPTPTSIRPGSPSTASTGRGFAQAYVREGEGGRAAAAACTAGPRPSASGGG